MLIIEQDPLIDPRGRSEPPVSLSSMPRYTLDEAREVSSLHFLIFVKIVRGLR